MSDPTALCAVAKEASRLASAIIMTHYQKLPKDAISQKADKSYVTEADRASHEVIAKHLRVHSDYPILSEEGDAPERYRDAKHLWVVDPLDGTRNYLAADGGFVVNIALLEAGRPVVGVMMVPAQNRLFFATQGGGAYCEDASGVQRLQVSTTASLTQSSWLVSRFHAKSDAIEQLHQWQVADIQPMGSALKYCQIAEGSMDASLRYTPLMEWDICAADCLLTEAGGRISDLKGNPLKYQQANPLIDSGLLASNGVLHDEVLAAI